MKELNKLRAETFDPELRNLLTATANKLDREWPRSQNPYAQLMPLSLILTATNVYNAMIYLCADTPKNPLRKPEYALVLPSLSRVVLEALLTLVFTLDDLKARTERYHRSGWRDSLEELDRIRTRYGSDPSWQGYISELETLLQGFKDELKITDDDAKKTSDKRIKEKEKPIKRWPPLREMKQEKELSSDRRVFLEYLQDWFYRELSQDAHLSFRGLVRSSGYLLSQMKRENDPGEMAQRKGKSICTTVVLLLSLMSEIEVEFSFGLDKRLRDVWDIINSVFPQGQEIYDMRYADILN